MSTKTKAAQTALGEIEYETRTCASCGQEHLPEDTTTMFKGSLDEINTYSSFESVHFHGTVDRVYFCEYCVEDPAKVTLEYRKRISQIWPMILSSFAVGVLLGSVLL